MPPPDSPSPQTPAARSWPRRVLNRLEVDRAVFFVLLARGWQFLAGPVSILLIAQFFSPVEQGFYYTFASLMALQTLVELGLHGVVLTVASHEWAGLEVAATGEVQGDESALRRLSELHRWTSRWYAALAVMFALGVGAAGYFFLRQKSVEGIDWEAPWGALVALNGVLIWLWALTAVLEGCNQVVAVNRCRLMQAVAGNLAVWPSIALGAGLWAPVIATAVRVAFDLWLVAVRYGPFFRSLRQVIAQGALRWKEEVWPLQWRTGARSIVAYFALQLFTPVMFHYHGPEAAGRMGMTWTALAALEAAAFAWLQARTPLLGMLIARRDYRELDRIFFRLTAISCLMLLAGGLLLCAVIGLLPVTPFPLAQKLSQRMLPLLPTALFVAGLATFNLVRCLGVYVLAHKRDPFLLPGLATCAVTAALVWGGGKHYGAEGAAAGYALAVILGFLPAWWLVWRTARRVWH